MIVFKKSTLSFHLLVFLLSSLFFVYISYCLIFDFSALRYDALRAFTDKFGLFLLPIILVTAFLIYKHHKLSLIFYSLFQVTCSLIVADLFMESFDKFILLILFLHVLMSYYYYLFWKYELSKACYCNNMIICAFREQACPEIQIEVERVIQDGAKNETFSARLVNWDDSSCFLFFIQNTDVDHYHDLLPGDYRLKFSFNNRVFWGTARLVTKSKDGGFGFLFHIQSSDMLFAWGDFYRVLSDRGLLPSRIFF